MRKSGKALLFMLALAGPIGKLSGQGLPTADKKLVDAARARYYSLPLAGFAGETCGITFDLSTVPLLPVTPADPLRALVENTAFTLQLSVRGVPTVEHHLPAGSSDAVVKSSEQVLALMTAFIAGVFQTWTSKGLSGPIPPFDSQIKSVSKAPGAIAFTVADGGPGAVVTTDDSYLVKQIRQGTLLEYPTYRATPHGLIYSGTHAIDGFQTDQPTDVRYDIETESMSGLELPARVRIRVNQNIDVRYALTGCTVQKGVVLKVGPPAMQP